MDACDLHYKQYGQDGPAVVILHGLFGMLDNWQTFARRLAARKRVYVPDLRNHGRSCHRDAMGYEEMAGDLAHFFDSRGLSSVYLLGHSMGGKLAMYFALLHPDRVGRLVVVDIAPRRYRAGHQEIFDALAALDLRGSRSDIERALLTRIPDRRIVLFLLKNLRRAGREGFVWKMSLPALRAGYERINGWPDVAGQYDGPALFVAGKRSGYIKSGDRELVRRYFPQAKWAELDAGHWVHAERPDELLALTDAFFAE